MTTTTIRRSARGSREPAFFLTALDPRARVRGSRDGLGAQPVWAATARPLIGNLTTVTSSLKGFTSLLVGLRLAERAEAGGAASADDAFLVWEQMAGYARHVAHQERSFFGLQLVASRTGAAQTSGGKVRLSAEPSGQIMGNQRTNGLLGNYVSASRVSGLVLPGFPSRLTPEAAAFVDDTYLPRLAQAWGRDARDLVRALGQNAVSFDLRPNARLDAIASIFGRLADDEAAFYRRSLVNGGPADPTKGRQGRLAALLEPRLSDSDGLSQPLIAQLVEDADARGWADIAGLLRRVAACESVLAPATALFRHLLGRDSVHVDEIAADVQAQWGARLTSIRPEALSVLPPGHWHVIATALDHGDYPEAIKALVEHNGAIMKDRGGLLPWLEIDSHGRLRVRIRGEDAADLPAGQAAQKLWLYPYFIPSLRAVLTAIQEARP